MSIVDSVETEITFHSQLTLVLQAQLFVQHKNIKAAVPNEMVKFAWLHMQVWSEGPLMLWWITHQLWLLLQTVIYTQFWALDMGGHFLIWQRTCAREGEEAALAEIAR